LMFCFSSRRRHTRSKRDWSSDVCSSDLDVEKQEDENDNSLHPFEQEVVDLTNQEREKQGLAPLEIDSELSVVSKDKSKDMLNNQYFSHDSPTYGSPFDMM